MHKQTLRQLNLVERDDNDSILKLGKLFRLIWEYLQIEAAKEWINIEINENGSMIVACSVENVWDLNRTL